jgi:hypothetical protein
LSFFGDPSLYQIKVATKSTDDGGCDNAQTLSGDGGKPVQLGGQDVTQMEFDWPANLASNAYYFCVFPMATPTAAPTATATTQSSPVSSPAATATPKPTPVVTPVISGPNEAHSTIPFVYTRDAGAKVALPTQTGGTVTAGAQVQVTLSNWLSKNRAAPTSVSLTPLGQQDSPNANAPVSATFSVSSPPDSKGNCTLLVTIPSTLTSDKLAVTPPYLMIVGGPGIYQRSDPFTITPALSPTVPVSPTPTHVAGGSGGGGLLVILGWILAVLAFLGAIGGVLYLALNSHRASPDAPQPRDAAPWGENPNARWGRPQGGLWDDAPQDSWGVGPSNWGQGPQGSRPDWDAPTEPGRWPGDRP